MKHSTEDKINKETSSCYDIELRAKKSKVFLLSISLDKLFTGMGADKKKNDIMRCLGLLKGTGHYRKLLKNNIKTLEGATAGALYAS